MYEEPTPIPVQNVFLIDLILISGFPLSMRGSIFFVRPVRNSRSPGRQNAVVIRQQSCNTVARLSPFFGLPLLSRCLQVSLSFSPIAEICRKHLQFLFERKSFLYAPPVATSRSMGWAWAGLQPAGGADVRADGRTLKRTAFDAVSYCAFPIFNLCSCSFPFLPLIFVSHIRGRNLISKWKMMKPLLHALCFIRVQL